MELEAQKRKHRDQWNQIPALTSKESEEFGRTAARTLLTQPWFGRAPVVGLFYPRPHELNLLSLLETSEPRFYFPKVEPQAMELRFFQVKNLEGFSSGYAGIPEPASEKYERTEWLEEDIILVPGLLFDKSGSRIGTGKGFYDRFLAKAPAIRVGVCASRYVVNGALAQEETDVRMDFLLTERGLERCT